MGAPAVTREASIRAMRDAASPEGVAMTSREWKLQRRQPSMNGMMAHFPGRWAELCDAAGLVSPRAALDQRRRTAKRVERERLESEGREPPRVESFKARRVRERGEAKREQVDEAVAAGDLVIRRATPEEMARFQVEREACGSRGRSQYVPTVDELDVLPGVKPKPKPAVVEPDTEEGQT